MGLALNEEKKEQKAIEFYQLMSSLRFIPSTPTLFHSGLKRAQLTIGASVKSINIETSGMISFLKGAEVTTHMISRSGRRRGATAAYLEVWHLEIEDFLDLRRNVGDERRRTHDTPDLHHIYGLKFAERYLYYEQEFQVGKIKLAKQIKAFELCNIRSPQDHCGVVHSSNLCTEITLNTSEKETAVCNLGSVNLARHLKKENQPIQTEIAAVEKILHQTRLNLSQLTDENRGKKIPVAKFELEAKLLALKKQLQFDDNLLQETITLAIRMLDNVIDLNSELFTELCPEAEYANSQHRPIGLGMMGFQDALFELAINYNSPAALKFTDELTEKFSYYALAASCQLAEERGTYASYRGSK
ncbi:1496_t:CDS:2, partial [Funneliformis geosporum]